MAFVPGPPAGGINLKRRVSAGDSLQVDAADSVPVGRLHGVNDDWHTHVCMNESAGGRKMTIHSPVPRERMATHFVRWNEPIPTVCRGGALTIGNFDGVHR